MGGGSAQTVGYRYKIGMHLGLCHGPVDALQEIRAGDLTIWKGERYDNATTTAQMLIHRFIRPKDLELPVLSTSDVTANEQIRIYAPRVFGGDDREGGVSGYLDVQMGGDSQGANAYLTAQQGAAQPAYRGILSVVFRQGLISSNNPYIKPWKFRLKRLFQGWDGAVWNSTKCAIDLGDGVIAMNPAHIIYECFTNRKWGHGMPAANLDLASFATAADTFYNEGLGLCMVWQQQELIDEFIQKIINHAGAAVGEDPKTGLYRLKAMRADYTLGALPVFSFANGNLVSIEQCDRASITEAKNEITVRFNNQKTGKGSSVTVHNLAVVQPNGAPSSQTITYPGLPTVEIATRVALRDMKAFTSGIARIRIIVDRSAYGLLPGDVIAFSDPDDGIELMPVRLAAVDYGSLAKGEITLEGVQDVFGLGLTSYIAAQPVAWVEPSRDPVASTNILAFEMPYRDLVRQLTYTTAQDLDPNAGYLATVALRAPGSNLGYELHTRTGANDYAIAQGGEWTPSGTLSATITPTTTSITVNASVDLDQVGTGQAAFIDNEMVRIETYNPATGAVTIARGCGDTVPAPHSSGARVWFYETFESMDPIEWATSEVVDAKVRTLTQTTIGSIASSPGASVTMSQRAYRPYPPGLFRINTNAYPATVPVGSDIVVSWAHRDRLAQQEQVVDTLASSIGPEAGTTYTMEVSNATTLAVLSTVTGISGTTSTILLATLGAATNIRIRLWAVRGGLASRQEHNWVVSRV